MQSHLFYFSFLLREMIDFSEIITQLSRFAAAVCGCPAAVTFRLWRISAASLIVFFDNGEKNAVDAE
jgi:hypothetical protein